MKETKPYIKITNRKNLTTTRISTSHPFFNRDRLTCKLFSDRVELGVVTIDTTLKSYSVNTLFKDVNGGCDWSSITVSDFQEYEGTYLIDMEESTEDSLVVSFEDHIE